MKRKYKIHIARTAGFCFGVKRAIRLARELAGSGRQIRMLGDLVHNQDVIKELEQAGIKKIKRLGNGRGRILLVRAHGAGIRTIALARRRGYKIIDATCPMVKAIHKIAGKMSRKGYTIIVLGDKRHEEVQGIVGQAGKKTYVIDNSGHIPKAIFEKIIKAAVVVQSTQNADDILPIVATLRSGIKELKFFNTICKPTTMKQAEMKTMPLENDVMIVIGSRASANTRRLYEISRKLNPRSHWIESTVELKARWFKKAKSIGITAGASTPETTIQSVINALRRRRCR